MLLPLINPQDNGEQLRPAGKGPDKGPQEASAAGQIMGNFTHSCPRKAVFFFSRDVQPPPAKPPEEQSTPF